MSDFHNPYDHGAAHDHGAPPTEHEILERALREILIEKGVVPAEVLRQALESRETGSPAPAARIVARMWVDPGFQG